MLINDPNGGEITLETALNKLFDGVAMHVNGEAAWEGLPDNLIVTTGRDGQYIFEYVLLCNWRTRDRASISRPMLDFDSSGGEWSSVFPEEEEIPLYKVNIRDLLDRAYTFKLDEDTSTHITDMNFEVFSGRIGMWGAVEDSPEDYALAMAKFGEEAYANLLSEITGVVEFSPLLEVPELTPESFLAD